MKRVHFTIVGITWVGALSLLVGCGWECNSNDDCSGSQTCIEHECGFGVASLDTAPSTTDTLDTGSATTDTGVDTVDTDTIVGTDWIGEVDSDGVVQLDCSGCDGVGGSSADMLCAIDLCHPHAVLINDIDTPSTNFDQCSVSDCYEAVTHFGNPQNDLAPKKNKSYALMATGKAEGTDHSTACEMYGISGFDTFANEPQNDVMHDLIEWKLRLKAPENAQSFRFKFVFFSQEYDDYISSVYNDKFYAILEAKSTRDGQKTIINYTDCRDPLYTDFDDFNGCDLPSRTCCYIAINSALSECCWYPTGSEWMAGSADMPSCPNSDPADNTDISGTGYECALSVDTDGPERGSSTGWLQTHWPIKGGEDFTLTFHIHDTYDGIYDSQVIIDSFEFLGYEHQGTEIIIE